MYGDSLVSVILYGSYARGDYDETSDIDIVAIAQGDRAMLQEQLKEVWNNYTIYGIKQMRNTQYIDYIIEMEEEHRMMLFFVY